MALYSVSRHAYMAENIMLDSRGKAIALFGGVNRVGRFAGPALGGILATAYGLRMPFLLVGAIEVAALGAIVSFVRAEGGSAKSWQRLRLFNGFGFAELAVFPPPTD